MAQTTPATLALRRFGIAFELRTYDYDPGSECVGLQAAQALGEPAARLLKTLIPQPDGKPVSLLKSPCSQGTGLPTKTSADDFRLFEQGVTRGCDLSTMQWFGASWQMRKAIADRDNGRHRDARRERAPPGRPWPSTARPVPAQNCIRPRDRFSNEDFGRRFSIIRTGRSPLLQPEHLARVRGNIAAEQGNYRRRQPSASKRLRSFRYRKQFRPRDARSDGAGRQLVGRQQRYLQRAAVEDEARGNPCRARDACGFGGGTQSMPTAHGASDAHRRR